MIACCIDVFSVDQQQQAHTQNIAVAQQPQLIRRQALTYQHTNHVHVYGAAMPVNWDNLVSDCHKSAAVKA